MEAMNGNYLGIGGMSLQIRSKSDAMKYAFDITTEKNYSTGEVKVNREKAMEVYNTFVDNIQLPDVEKEKDFMDKYIPFLQTITDKKKEKE